MYVSKHARHTDVRFATTTTTSTAATITTTSTITLAACNVAPRGPDKYPETRIVFMHFQAR
jgi:hypothetical protein